MRAIEVMPGEFHIEIFGEKCRFFLTDLGIHIQREKHSSKLLSFEDLISKADKQLVLFPLPEPKI